MQKCSTTLRLLKRAVSSQTIGRTIFLELILRKDNLNNAYKQVKKTEAKAESMVCRWMNFCPSLENQETLIQEIKGGKYKPNPVRRVEIPKETKGEYRKLGVPTVVDRVIQQAIAQELSQSLRSSSQRTVLVSDRKEGHTMP